MKFYCIVFVWSACVLVDSLVHGLSCYNCDGDDDANCTLYTVPEHNAVETCDPHLYADRKPMCRLAIYYEWVDGEKSVTNIYRTGCTYVENGWRDKCTTETIGRKYGSAECICLNNLCNQFVPPYYLA